MWRYSRQTGLRAHEIWKKDEIKAKTAAERGFTLFVVWESEYTNNPTYVTEKIKEWWNEDIQN